MIATLLFSYERLLLYGNTLSFRVNPQQTMPIRSGFKRPHPVLQSASSGLRRDFAAESNTRVDMRLAWISILVHKRSRPLTHANGLHRITLHGVSTYRFFRSFSLSQWYLDISWAQSFPKSFTLLRRERTYYEIRSRLFTNNAIHMPFFSPSNSAGRRTLRPAEMNFITKRARNVSRIIESDKYKLVCSSLRQPNLQFRTKIAEEMSPRLFSDLLMMHIMHYLFLLFTKY